MLTLATSLLLISQVSAGVLGHVGHRVRRDITVDQVMKRYVDAIVEPIQRRQTSATGVNATEWDAQTQAACTASLEALNGVSSNPAGMAVCYNLPYLNNSTGVFEADLRLYMIAAPTGDFANIASANVQIGLTYSGSTVSPVNASALKRDVEGGTSLISWPKKRAETPTLVQSYAFVGQINQAVLTGSMSTAELEAAVMPAVTLSGTDASGNTVSTNLTNAATFVTGTFSEAATTTTVTKTEVSPPIQTLVVASASPFVVPGITILIFPIGGIITGVWTILFCATIIYGTVGRMQFREQFRRRAAAATKGSLARI